jgi:hypothetical protein
VAPDLQDLQLVAEPEQVAQVVEQVSHIFVSAFQKKPLSQTHVPEEIVA